jgi:hypothetical protein
VAESIGAESRAYGPSTCITIANIGKDQKLNPAVERMLRLPSNLKNAKVVDLVERARVQLEQLVPTRERLGALSEWYYRKYFLPGKATPLVHIMIVVGTIGYLIEYPHLRKELEHANH